MKYAYLLVAQFSCHSKRKRLLDDAMKFSHILVKMFQHLSVVHECSMRVMIG